MGIVVDAHRHMSCEVPGKKYFPWQHTWHTCMSWAYGVWSPTKGMPPYERDPHALYPKQGLRFADPDGTWTIASMDEAGIDLGILLPLDYDWSWGGESAVSIEEKHLHHAEMVQKYPGRFVALAGPDPRRPGVEEIFDRAIKEYGMRGLKLVPKAGYYVWDERVYPLYERCVDQGLPVFVCTEPDGGGYNRDRFAEPIHLSDVVGDYPDMPVVMLHAGEPLYHWFEEALLVASRAANAYIELNFWIQAPLSAEPDRKLCRQPGGGGPAARKSTRYLGCSPNHVGYRQPRWAPDGKQRARSIGMVAEASRPGATVRCKLCS